jgi:hypothetical protein
MKRWDVFISHASEDKDAFVRPLALALTNLRVSTWYDEFTLKLGDSLSQSIDHGLANSRFGVVVISRSFLAKPWPAYELAGLVTREIISKKVILPIWHQVTREDVMARSATLADKLALRTADSLPEDIALQVMQVVRPDVYRASSRDALIMQMNGKVLRELRNELVAIRNELNEFHCPDCGAPIMETRDVDIPGESKARYKVFVCGRRQFDGDVTDLCPSNPRFPKFDELPISFSYSTVEPGCLAFVDPRTEPSLWLDPVIGKNEQHAKQLLKESYDKRARKHRK